MIVHSQVLVPLTIGKYQDEILCDVLPMEAGHILLGRPWQFDKKVIHDGFTNRYSFVHNGRKTILAPLTPPEVYQDQLWLKQKDKEREPLNTSPPNKEESLRKTKKKTFESKPERQPNFLVRSSVVKRAMFSKQTILLFVYKEVLVNLTNSVPEVPSNLSFILQEFKDVFPEENPKGLPPIRGIEHQIDFVPGASLPNRPAYIIHSGETREFQKPNRVLMDFEDIETAGKINLCELGERSLPSCYKNTATLTFEEYGLISFQLHFYNFFLENRFQKLLNSCGEMLAEPSFDTPKLNFEWNYATENMEQNTYEMPKPLDNKKEFAFHRPVKLQSLTYSSRLKETIPLGRSPVMEKTVLCNTRGKKEGSAFEQNGYCVNKGRREKVYEEGDQVWIHLRKERFPEGRKSKLMPRIDGPFKIIKKINNNAYQLDLQGKYDISNSFNITDLVPFIADNPDLRTNPFQEGGDDMSMETPTLGGKEEGTMAIPKGPITRARSRKLQEAVGNILRIAWKHEEAKERQHQDMLTSIQVALS